MSADDIIALPGQPGKHARRAVVEAWQAAGSPRVNSAGRLYGEQKRLYDGWARRLSGFSPADNPDAPWLPLAHVRFVALDIDPTPARIAALTRAGLVRPYSYEPWHWQLPGDVRRFALVTAIPASANATPFNPVEDDMFTDADRELLKDVQNRIRGPKSDIDMLQDILSASAETRMRVRGGRPEVDMLQDILGRVGGTVVDVDEAALAVELAPALAPYLASNLGTLSDESIAALATAAADEQDRRARGRLEQ
ncbi:hypothetical protein J2X03_003779 [Microbacterium trichothecenolyticum]|uniref:hypothetical protein n=1 Tax=Microbacterium trichothecenolyticum TaxID=69370 RepID=UPI0028612B39|nr:hypothetical protein [Microbacterium trichothecenolyticum]MDR7113877.1 hypothetical protein [Microbacterium trichothecenolyticum]